MCGAYRRGGIPAWSLLDLAVRITPISGAAKRRQRHLAERGIDPGKHRPRAAGHGVRQWYGLMDQIASSMNRTRSPFGLAPAIDCTGWPPLKMVSVGTDITR